MNKKKTRTIESSDLELIIPSNKSDSIKRRSGHSRSKSGDGVVMTDRNVGDPRRASTTLSGDMNKQDEPAERPMVIMDASHNDAASSLHRKSVTFIQSPRKDNLNASNMSIGSLSTASVSETVTTTISEAKDIKTFLHILDLEQYWRLFEASKMQSVLELVNLTDLDLEDLGITNAGHRRLIILSGQSWRAEQQRAQMMKVHETVGNMLRPDSRPARQELKVKQSSSTIMMSADENGDSDSLSSVSRTPTQGSPMYLASSQSSSTARHIRSLSVNSTNSMSGSANKDILHGKDKMDMIKSIKASKKQQQQPTK
jgi:uncharacterized protein YjiS (DUF1127 family)